MAQMTADFPVAATASLGAVAAAAAADATAKVAAQHVVDNGTYVPITRPTILAPGRLWIMAGDSIIGGTGSSPAARGVAKLAPRLAGTARISNWSYASSVSGNTSAQLLARFTADVLTPAPNGVHLQIGTNDASQAVPIATFIANVTAMVAACRALSIPVTIGLVPPRSSAASAAIHAAILAYNYWLRLWAGSQQVQLADTYGVLVDTATGYLLAACDSGDGVHPSNEGHLKMAVAIAAAFARATPNVDAVPFITAKHPLEMALNPLMAGTSGSLPTSHFAGTATGTAPTHSMFDDTSGDLPAGKWWQIDFDAVSGGVRQFSHALSVQGGVGVGWNVADGLLFQARMQIEDMSGYYAAAIAGTANVRLAVTNQAGAEVAAAVEYTGATSPGHIAWSFAGPAVGTGLICYLTITLPTGTRAKVRLGAVSCINLTRQSVPSLSQSGFSPNLY